jgi:hypothetical protein
MHRPLLGYSTELTAALPNQFGCGSHAQLNFQGKRPSAQPQKEVLSFRPETGMRLRIGLPLILSTRFCASVTLTRTFACISRTAIDFRCSPEADFA